MNAHLFAKGGTSEREQADYSVQMMNLAKRLDIERLFFYELRAPEIEFFRRTFPLDDNAIALV